MLTAAALLLTGSMSVLPAPDRTVVLARDGAEQGATGPRAPSLPGPLRAQGSRAHGLWSPPDWRDPLRLDLEVLVAGELRTMEELPSWDADLLSEDPLLETLSPLYENVMRLYDNPTPWASVVVRVDPFGTGPCD